MPTTLKQTAPSLSLRSEVKLSLVPQADIDGVWFLAEPLLLRSYRKGDQNIPVTLRGDLRSGHRQLWLLTEDVTILAAVVTCIVAKRSGLALKIEHLGGGSMRKWWHLRSEMETFAKSQGCKKLMFEGSKGWQRLRPDCRVIAVIMEKRLDDG